MKIGNLLLWSFLAFFALSCHAACDEGSTPGAFPFEDEHAVAAFLSKLQVAVSGGEPQAVAALVRFPVLAGSDGKMANLSRKTLLSRFNDVFSPKVRAAILAARFQSTSKYQCVFWNDQGLMLGDGEVWINATDDGIKVVTVNN